MGFFRALKPAIAIWVGILLYSLTSSDWWLAAGSAFMLSVLTGAYYYGHTRDSLRRW